MPDTGIATIPDAPRYWLNNATVPACLVDANAAFLQDVPATDASSLLATDILIEDGKIAELRPTSTGSDSSSFTEDITICDLDGAMVWPGFVDMHTHLDKGHIWPRAANPDGTFIGALETAATDRIARWNAEDIRARMDFALRSAYTHGTTAIRTHLDSSAPQHQISWPVFTEFRQEWRGRIALQASSIIGIDGILDEFGTELATTVARHDGVLGVVTYMIDGMEAAIDRMFDLAIHHCLDLDLHVDETGDPGAVALRMVAERAVARKFDGRIVAGHCSSLACQDEADIDATLDLVAEAGIAVVSLPMCNMYLQDRTPGRTPRWRGVTLLHEMRARGIAVAVASDNTRDPFYAYGDLDPLEVFREAVRILHLDHPLGDWPSAITRWPADIIGLPDHGRIAPGLPADLVVCRGRNYSEILSRPQSDRTVLRDGRPIARDLPDYRELDLHMGKQ